jgi:hypothetical protein
LYTNRRNPETVKRVSAILGNAVLEKWSSMGRDKVKKIGQYWLEGVKRATELIATILERTGSQFDELEYVPERNPKQSEFAMFYDADVASKATAAAGREAQAPTPVDRGNPIAKDFDMRAEKLFTTMQLPVPETLLGEIRAGVQRRESRRMSNV